MPIPQGKKRKKKRVNGRDKGRRTKRKNLMGSKGLHRGEVQRKDRLHLEELKKTENSLHRTLQDRQASRC